MKMSLFEFDDDKLDNKKKQVVKFKLFKEKTGGFSEFFRMHIDFTNSGSGLEVDLSTEELKAIKAIVDGHLGDCSDSTIFMDKP